jgi:K+-transporting ATPase ATPase A chain
MSLNDYIQIGVYLLVLLLAVKPLGIYMARIYEGSPTGVNVWFAPVEKWIYRLCGVKSEEGMNWKVYAFALMLFNILGLLVVYAIQRFQAGLPRLIQR